MSGPSGNPPCPACGKQMRFKLPTPFLNYLHWACPKCGHVEKYEQEFRDQ